MKKALSEKQVLKKLGIKDFHNLTAEKLIPLGTMLERMEPEVAEKALEQFPEFASTMCQIFTEYKQLLDDELKQNTESVKAFYDACDKIIAACQEELKRDDLPPENRVIILGKMIDVAKMIGEKDSENKKFIIAAQKDFYNVLLLVVPFVITPLIAVLCRNYKVNTDLD